MNKDSSLSPTFGTTKYEKKKDINLR